MRIIYFAILLTFTVKVNACNFSNLTSNDVTTLSAIIYKIEGGDKAKRPYGIFSVKVNDKAHAKRICENTIRNNFKRWKANSQGKCFLNYLGDRYCPKEADYQGNINWKKNIHFFWRKHLAEKTEVVRIKI